MDFPCKNQLDALISQTYVLMKLYMFRTLHLPIIRSFFTVHSEVVYVIQVCRQFSCRNRIEMLFHPGPARKLIYRHVQHISLLNIQCINSWWWTDELSETCIFYWQNNFVKLVHVFSSIIRNVVGCTVTWKGNTYTTVVGGGTMNEDGKTSVLNPVSISYVNMSSVRTIKHV